MRRRVADLRRWEGANALLSRALCDLVARTGSPHPVPSREERCVHSSSLRASTHLPLQARSLSTPRFLAPPSSSRAFSASQSPSPRCSSHSGSASRTLCSPQISYKFLTDTLQPHRGQLPPPRRVRRHFSNSFSPTNPPHSVLAGAAIGSLSAFVVYIIYFPNPFDSSKLDSMDRAKVVYGAQEEARIALVGEDDRLLRREEEV